MTSVIFILNLSGNADYIRSAKLSLEYFHGEVGVFSKYDSGYNHPTCSNSCSKLLHIGIYERPLTRRPILRLIPSKLRRAFARAYSLQSHTY